MVVIKKYSLLDSEEYINDDVNEFIRSLNDDDTYEYWDVEVKVTDKYIVFVFDLWNE